MFFEGKVSPRVFGVPPCADFPRALIAGLRERLNGHPPEAIARVTIYLNSERMQRRIRAILTENGAHFLPRLQMVTHIGADMFLSPEIKPIPALRLRLQLGVLVSRLLEKEPGLAPQHAAADLSARLARLMSEMQAENILPEDISRLDVSDFSDHWQRISAFLSIISPFFATASQSSFTEQMSIGGYQRFMAEKIAKQWQKTPPTDLVIIAGSTGSRKAMAVLMKAVTQLPQGALVLPGFDTNMPPHAWNMLKDPLTGEDHPQYRFAKLFEQLEITAHDVQEWCNPANVPAIPSKLAARNKVISLAMRPAPATDQWQREAQDLPDLENALSDVTLIEAPSTRQETTAIALILRQAAENKETATLITPDRTLARQVSANLNRWGITPDDSAGLPLNQSAPGRFLRQIARLHGERIRFDQLLALLKHPLTASGMERGLHLLLTRTLELELRERGPTFPLAKDIIAWTNAQPHKNSLEWAHALAKFMKDIAHFDSCAPFAHHLQKLKDMAECLARGPAIDGSGTLWEGTSGQEALSFMTDLTKEAEHGGEMNLDDFRDLFESLIAERTIRDPTLSHPGISILGTIEARIQGADLVILAGLNDGIWPPTPEIDPWMNRKMRKEAGLFLPERRIGLSAHDFQQALAAPRVFLTRSRHSTETETIPSRWLNRLSNLLEGLHDQKGPDILRHMRQRGEKWQKWAAELDQPTTAMSYDPGLLPAQRPSPCPPLSTRPKHLSLTRIETLIRDPYAIYADKILHLKPLKPLRPQADDARDRGILIHKILEYFVRQKPQNETYEEAYERLIHLSESFLSTHAVWPAARILWGARIKRAADHFLALDRDAEGIPKILEEKGLIYLKEIDFSIYGTLDRVDILPDGSLHLIDYKTGSLPTPKQIRQFAKQLHLAALIAQEGGFADLGPHPVSKITYIGLNGRNELRDIILTPKEIALTKDGLLKTIGNYQKEDKGYTSRRAPFTEHFPGNYDQLARFGEWEMTDRPQSTRVGNDLEESPPHDSE